MFQIYLPTASADDWKRFLADPDLHWKKGYSARALAYAWEQSKQQGLPREVADAFAASGIAAFQTLTPLLAFPERQVSLPGGRRPSQTDLFVLAKDYEGRLVSMAVEGKVNESFDQTIGEWYASPSAGKQKRLAFLQQTLNLSAESPPTIRYQLLHRAASAVLEATRFNARSAVMLVHSFSPTHKWFEDYQAFGRLFGIELALNTVAFASEINAIQLYLGWVQGDAEFLDM